MDINIDNFIVWIKKTYPSEVLALWEKEPNRLTDPYGALRSAVRKTNIGEEENLLKICDAEIDSSGSDPEAVAEAAI